jgi:mRNA interferase MazF
MPSRGDVYMARLNPSQGSEQGGERPVVIVSRDAININSPVVIVVSLIDAQNKKRIYPSQTVLKAGDGGLRIDSIALCDQVRAISVTRLTTRLGHIAPESIASINAALKIALDLL